MCLVTSCMSFVGRYWQVSSPYILQMLFLVMEGKKEAFLKNSLVFICHVSHFLLSLSPVLQDGMLMFLVGSVDIEKAAVGQFPKLAPQDQ